MHYFIFLLLSAAASKPHKCNWEDCDHIGKTRFVATWHASRCSIDALQAETIHFYCPALSYEIVEDIVLTNINK